MYVTTFVISDNNACPQKTDPGDDLGGNTRWITHRSLSDECVDRDDGEGRGARGNEHVRSQPGWTLCCLALVANYASEEKRQEDAEHQFDIEREAEVRTDHNPATLSGTSNQRPRESWTRSSSA